ncbi:MAG: YihY/virulence factor BrkB family protein [Hyphomicrobiales bacterium]
MKIRIRNIKSSIIKFTRRATIRGFQGLPIYDVMSFFWKGLYDGALGLRASAIAFNFFMAIFPTILFFFTLIPYIPINDFQMSLFGLIQEVIPEKTYQAVSSTLFDILTIPHSSLLSIGFLMALIFSTNGIHALIDSFNSSFHVVETRSWIRQRITAIFLVLILSVLVVLGIALLSFGTDVLKYLVKEGYLRGSFTFELIQIGKWIVILLIFLFSYSFLYYMAPAKRKPFSFLSVGSILSTVLTILFTFGFNYYIDRFSRYNALYGSIGTLMIFLLWLYFSAYVLLIGFELNTSIYNAKLARKEKHNIADKQ